MGALDRSAVRVWGERIAVLVAGGASLATPQARWYLNADGPSGAVRTGAVVTVEASVVPTVRILSSPTPRGLLAEYGLLSGPWTGRGEFFVPPGSQFEGASLRGNCTSSGPCSGACDPPAGTFVRVLRIDPVESWAISGQSGAVTLPVARATVEASGPPDVEVIPSTPSAPSVLMSRVGGTAYAFEVRWDVAPETVSLPFQWTFRATVRGYCRTAPCIPPAEARVAVRVER
ncbi:MAG: hypothetical protein WCI05_11510 [Myxococcales bacterium]